MARDFTLGFEFQYDARLVFIHKDKKVPIKCNYERNLFIRNYNNIEKSLTAPVLWEGYSDGMKRFEDVNSLLFEDKLTGRWMSKKDSTYVVSPLRDISPDSDYSMIEWFTPGAGVDYRIVTRQMFNPLLTFVEWLKNQSKQGYTINASWDGFVLDFHPLWGIVIDIGNNLLFHIDSTKSLHGAVQAVFIIPKSIWAAPQINVGMKFPKQQLKAFTQATDHKLKESNKIFQCFPFSQDALNFYEIFFRESSFNEIEYLRLLIAYSYINRSRASMEAEFTGCSGYFTLPKDRFFRMHRTSLKELLDLKNLKAKSQDCHPAAYILAYMEKTLTKNVMEDYPFLKYQRKSNSKYTWYDSVVQNSIRQYTEVFPENDPKETWYTYFYSLICDKKIDDVNKLLQNLESMYPTDIVVRAEGIKNNDYFSPPPYGDIEVGGYTNEILAGLRKPLDQEALIEWRACLLEYSRRFMGNLHEFDNSYIDWLMEVINNLNPDEL